MSGGAARVAYRAKNEPSGAAVLSMRASVGGVSLIPSDAPAQTPAHEVAAALPPPQQSSAGIVLIMLSHEAPPPDAHAPPAGPKTSQKARNAAMRTRSFSIGRRL